MSNLTKEQFLAQVADRASIFAPAHLPYIPREEVDLLVSSNAALREATASYQKDIDVIMLDVLGKMGSAARSRGSTFSTTSSRACERMRP